MTDQKTIAEKREEMFQPWVSGEGVEFVDDEAEVLYKEKAQRIKDAVELKEPDRVPVVPSVNFFSALYAGHTSEDIMYDYDKLEEATKNYVFDFEPDAYFGSNMTGPGNVFETIGYVLYKWPGHGAPVDTSYQCVEKEYMKPDEYKDLINDPSDFWLRKYLPRIAEELEPLKKLGSVTDVIELPFTAPYFLPYGMPDVQSALDTLKEAGEQAMEWMQRVGEIDGEVVASGYPVFIGGAAKAPFDILGDTLRGTSGVMVDIMRRPEKVLEAVDRLVPLISKMGIDQAKMNGVPMVFIPLHKGADSFMSREQFGKFYWPTLKQVIENLVAEGLVPFMFVEGSYNERLDIINDVPEKSTVWFFDDTEMEEVKDQLGDVACVGGNVPSSKVVTGTAQETREYSKKLIDYAGKDGGFILSNGAFLDNANLESLKAMVETAKEYGVYS